MMRKKVGAALLGATIGVLGAVQPVAAKSPVEGCAAWKARLVAAAARTKLLPPIGFKQQDKLWFEVTGLDAIEVIAKCENDRFTALEGVIRGRDAVTVRQWAALHAALGRTLDPALSDKQLDARIVSMTAKAKEEFFQDKARGAEDPRGDGLGDFDRYWMTVQLQGGRVGLSATLANDDD